MYLLLFGSKSQLSAENKLLLRKAILKPIWAYGIQLWSTASYSNIKYFKDFKMKSSELSLSTHLSMLHNNTLHQELNVLHVRDEIRRNSQRYADRMKEYPNILTKNFMKSVKTPRRLTRTSTSPIYLTDAIL